MDKEYDRQVWLEALADMTPAEKDAKLLLMVDMLRYEHVRDLIAAGAETDEDAIDIDRSGARGHEYHCLVTWSISRKCDPVMVKTLVEAGVSASRVNADHLRALYETQAAADGVVDIAGMVPMLMNAGMSHDTRAEFMPQVLRDEGIGAVCAMLHPDEDMTFALWDARQICEETDQAFSAWEAKNGPVPLRDGMIQKRWAQLVERGIDDRSLKYAVTKSGMNGTIAAAAAGKFDEVVAYYRDNPHREPSEFQFFSEDEYAQSVVKLMAVRGRLREVFDFWAARKDANALDRLLDEAPRVFVAGMFPRIVEMYRQTPALVPDLRHLTQLDEHCRNLLDAARGQEKEIFDFWAEKRPQDVPELLKNLTSADVLDALPAFFDKNPAIRPMPEQFTQGGLYYSESVFRAAVSAGRLKDVFSPAIWRHNPEGGLALLAAAQKLSDNRVQRQLTDPEAIANDIRQAALKQKIRSNPSLRLRK